MSRFANHFEARGGPQRGQKSSIGHQKNSHVKKACGKDGSFAPLENASRFPLSHSHGGDGLSTSDTISHPDVVV